MVALTGQPAPCLGPTQEEVYTAQDAKLEKLRPLGPPPVLAKKFSSEKRWDLWEWLSDGTLTARSVDRGLRPGPIVQWEHGWDMDNSEHQTELS